MSSVHHHGDGLLLLLLILICGGFLVPALTVQAALVAAELTEVPPLLDVPTYSLATRGVDGKTGMNILTYAAPVSVRPNRVWSIGLFKGTQAHENFARQKSGILQLLTEPQHSLVPLLGGSSGKEPNVDKQRECEILGYPWQKLCSSSGGTEGNNDDPLVLPRCAHYLRLSLLRPMYDAGSHDVAICKVSSMFVPDSSKSIPEPHLSTSKLREMGIITEQGRVADDWLT